MSAAFTPGPWGVDDEGHVRGYGQGSPYGEDLIAMPLGDTSEQAEANACLIASAPELYEALETLFAAFEKAAGLYGPCPISQEELANAVRLTTEALAKARGEAA